MGRGCTMDEWVHFQKLPEEGRVPNSSYWYVLCRHCVRGFEQKQLFNAPAKLTGRRSAMRAHLKICPMYATQYKMEQSALQVAAAEAEEGGEGAAEAAATNGKASNSSGNATPTVGDKRKRKAGAEGGGSRGGRGKHCMMEEWEHFIRLQDDGYIGKSNFFFAVCKHCQRAHDEAPADQQPLLAPERLVGRREKLRKHLSLCPHFKGELPPLERRLHPRGGGAVSAGVAFGVLAVGAGAAGAPAMLGGAMTAIGTTEASATGQPSNTTAVTTTGSSRLALDEWHYFTRLHRKKDSAYYFARCNFCQQAYENAPESMRASMEPVIVMGRKSNMQTHLAKCPHVPKDALALSKVYGTTYPSAGYSYNLGGVAGAGAGAGDLNFSAATKRTKLEAPLPLVSAPDGAGLHTALVEFLLEHHLPFEWVESASAKKLFRALVPIAGVADALVPTATELRTRVLDELHNTMLLNELAKLQELIPLELAAAAFSSEAADSLAAAPVISWPVMLQCSLSNRQSQAGEVVQLPAIEGVVTNAKVQVSLAFIRKQQTEAETDAGLAHYHGLEIARWLDEHMRLCVDLAKLTPALVVLPYNSATQRAVGVLRAPTRWPRVVFTANFEDLLQFPLMKLLATAEMFGVVSSLVELWQLETIRSCAMDRLVAEMAEDTTANPFRDWQSCAALMQALLDDRTFKSKRCGANAKKLVDTALSHSMLERVYTLLRAFTGAFANCRSGLTLSETLVQLGALFSAADGFLTVQLALEVVWAQLEQPLFVLAHALNPHVRLRGLNSTELTKLSALSDLSVTYFASLFGRKPNSLRGEVTAYLHTSQPVFARAFIGEFPVVEDYFRYLSDDYPSLSMLMRMLHSFSSVSTLPAQQGTKQSSESIYTDDEQQKLEFLRNQWGMASASKSDAGDDIKSHNEAPLLNAGAVVDEWKEALEAKLQARVVDFALLDSRFDAAGDSDMVEVDMEEAVAAGAVPANLPSLAADDELAFPSAPLRTPFAKKVLLKELFRSAEATI
ncbi:hypothetical protein BBJ28_00015249 [Nothophytophthora sp. Chile5]|nr:hypothetical protein BBJ28_00015249 [Nothophytophthora sp. Chile5]